MMSIHKEKRVQAQDVMTGAVATIPAGATVQEAAQRMIERGVSALPVVDEEDRVVGIVSEGDLVRRAELGTDVPASWWLQALAKDAARDYVKTRARAVADVMTRRVVSVRRATPLQDVARLLEKHRVKRVPVLAAGRLVGVVSRADLVRRLAVSRARPAPQSGGDRALRGRVLERLKEEGDVPYVNVTVEQGTVHLWGGVASAAQQKALRAAAKARGAREVEDHTFVMPSRLTGPLGR